MTAAQINEGEVTLDTLTLNRRIFTDKSTIGELFYKGELFSNSLEDTCRRVKIAKITAIPAGRYEIKLLPSPKYGRLMPRLLKVPNYEGVLIHWGNRPEDSDGCILVGNYHMKMPDFITTSRKTFDELFNRLNKESESLFITITGGLKA